MLRREWVVGNSTKVNGTIETSTYRCYISALKLMNTILVPKEGLGDAFGVCLFSFFFTPVKMNNNNKKIACRLHLQDFIKEYLKV